MYYMYYIYYICIYVCVLNVNKRLKTKDYGLILYMI